MKRFKLYDPKTNSYDLSGQVIALRTAAPTNLRVFDTGVEAHLVAQLCHGLFGISNEVDELEEGLSEFFKEVTTLDNKIGTPDADSVLAKAMVNVLEELGDIYWYAQLSAHHLADQFAEYETLSLPSESVVDICSYLENRLAAYHTTAIEGTTRSTSFDPSAVVWESFMESVSDALALKIRPSSAILANQAKRRMFYGKSIDIAASHKAMTELCNGLLNIMTAIIQHTPSRFTNTFDAMQYLIQNNIFKLAVRYMDASWTPESCFERDTESELSVYKMEDFFLSNGN